MPKVFIIADDLTGALDAAVAFSRPGLRVRVARTLDGLRDCLRDGADVIAVNTASRDATELHALTALQEIAAIMDLGTLPVLMKKVDSRLKGHPGAEAHALAELSGRSRLVAAPALPRMGRIQVAGAISGTGVAEPLPIAARLGAAALCPDIRTSAEMNRIVTDLGLDPHTLWIGASDLAFALARALHGAAAQPAPPLPRDLAVLVGSRDPITVAQVEHLENAGARIHHAPNGCAPSVRTGQPPFILMMTPGPHPCDTALAACQFAETAFAALSRMRPQGMICTGGETANAIMAQMGADSLELLGEVAPGIPAAAISTPWGRMTLATKSGGFGQVDTLTRLALDRNLPDNTKYSQDECR
ncbi:four-carbon acid sugar kinase family protein [Roseinatronobacter sp.]|uniref:four-carbon acid sugar kinase family protein n=1 Tax=Roseinatronobacter sp. TaxID=1945755 RepID=UPI0025D4CE67|nr:four-carbon acid sugar kinase family protein [Roseibaca sp.]